MVRLHHLSMREIIYNIEELEEYTNKNIDPAVLLHLLHNCPIDLTIPLTIKIYGMQQNSVPADDVSAHQNRQDKIIEDINAFLPRKPVTPRGVNRLERENQW